MPARLHNDIGYSITDKQDKAQWIATVYEIGNRIEELGFSEEIVFHGTSYDNAQAILEEGINPTVAFEMLRDGSEVMSEGSFWGTINTAAWYAEDTAFNRGGGKPTIIACPVSFLQIYTTLCADIPSRDFPIPGLSMLNDPFIAAGWATGTFRDWHDSLKELGSITAIHDYTLSLEQSSLVEDCKSLDRILLGKTFST